MKIFYLALSLMFALGPLWGSEAPQMHSVLAKEFLGYLKSGDNQGVGTIAPDLRGSITFKQSCENYGKRLNEEYKIVEGKEPPRGADYRKAMSADTVIFWLIEPKTEKPFWLCLGFTDNIIQGYIVLNKET